MFFTEFVDVTFKVGSHTGDVMESGVVVELSKETRIFGVQSFFAR